jgi:hypothetical protein
MHQCNLAGWSTKGQQADFDKKPKIYPLAARAWMRLISLPHRLLKQPFSQAPFKVILICLKHCDPLRDIPTSQAAHATSRLCKRRAGGIKKIIRAGQAELPANQTDA